MASETNENYVPGRGFIVYFNMSIFGQKQEGEVVDAAKYRFGAEKDVAMFSKMTSFLDAEYDFQPNLHNF